MESLSIVFIGGGRVAQCFIKELVDHHFEASRIWVSDLDKKVLNNLAEEFGVNVIEDDQEAVKIADMVVFSVKAQILQKVARSLAPVIQYRKSLSLSIAEGIHAVDLERWLGGDVPIIRCMPNVPIVVGSGVTALYANHLVNSKQKQLVESLLRRMGLVMWVTEESQLNAVIVLSSCGPAYFYLVMDSLREAAQYLGLDADSAKLLVLQTAFGAAKVAMESKESLEELKQQLISPNGITKAAVTVLEKKGIKDLFREAMEAAKRRSEKLAELLSHDED